ncbi:MAG: urea ABC transporter ATP-binding protein UrtD [Ruminococcus sp.]|jgi:urea transport system ATP-binding protein|nr:urea ABC transporter ATP-binding protein UrtD [Ruminococcus sp.]
MSFVGIELNRPMEVRTGKALDIKSVSVEFDGFKALTDVTVGVKRNTIHFFIGPNGAGKTTLLDIICAKTKPTSGTVHFYPAEGYEILLTGMKEYEIVNAGVGRKFQVPSVFTEISVYENMVLSLSGNKRIFASIFRKTSAEENDLIADVLDKVGLTEHANKKAGSLSHGQKQWLEIGMQLAARPKIIMLDEPAAGMGKPETFKTGELLQRIKDICTVIVVEHDMEFVKQVADNVTVLHEGKVLIEGNIDDVLADETVQKVYLGRGGD